MEITGSIKRVREQVREWRKAGLTVGLVPTMGYLHEGHKSLIDKAVEQNDKVVVSVFVIPMQFGPTEDLESYPRDMTGMRLFVRKRVRLLYSILNRRKCMMIISHHLLI